MFFRASSSLDFGVPLVICCYSFFLRRNAHCTQELSPQSTRTAASTILLTTLASTISHLKPAAPEPFVILSLEAGVR